MLENAKAKEAGSTPHLAVPQWPSNLYRRACGQRGRSDERRTTWTCSSVAAEYEHPKCRHEDLP